LPGSERNGAFRSSRARFPQAGEQCATRILARCCKRGPVKRLGPPSPVAVVGGHAGGMRRKAGVAKAAGQIEAEIISR